MHATSATPGPSADTKHKTRDIIVRFFGGGVLAIVHGLVVYEAGKFMFLEYLARFTDKYVFITPEPHGFLQAFVMVGVLGMIAAILPLLSWARSARWLLLSFALIIFEVPLPVVFSTQNSLYLNRANSAYVGESVLNDFYEKKKQYPASQQELDEFVATVRRPFLRYSWYARWGERLPYRFVYVPNASGPYTPNPPGPDPVTVYCAVSSDLQHYWTTGTDLRGPIGKEVDFGRGQDGGIIAFDENVAKHTGRKK